MRSFVVVVSVVLLIIEKSAPIRAIIVDELTPAP